MGCSCAKGEESVSTQQRERFQTQSHGTVEAKYIEPFPPRVMVEDIPIDPFANLESLFARVHYELEKPTQSMILSMNVNAANIAARDPAWRALQQKADLMYCDGAGIVLGARILGQQIPMRMTAADWLFDLLADLAKQQRTVYFLCGEPGIPERAMALFEKKVPGHTVVGCHHGYILQDLELEKMVIQEINDLQPDLLFVGFGMPLQEFWMEAHRHELNVSAMWALGATLDYLTGKVPRCPAWMGQAGLEWFFRLSIEPKRMFNRYVLGNTGYMTRILATAAMSRSK